MYAEATATCKAQDVAAQVPDADLIIAADTVRRQWPRAHSSASPSYSAPALQPVRNACARRAWLLQ
jgi:hypothetical protein